VYTDDKRLNLYFQLINVLVLYIFLAIFRFMETHGRIPKTSSVEKDTFELEKIKNTIMVELKLDKTIVDEDFSKYVIY